MLNGMSIYLPWESVMANYPSQAEAAAVVGVHQSTLSRWMRSDAPMPAEWAMAWHTDKRIPLWAMRPDLWPLQETA